MYLFINYRDTMYDTPPNTNIQVQGTSCSITNAMTVANKGELKTKPMLTVSHPYE